jgi:hypothetical protein
VAESPVWLHHKIERNKPWVIQQLTPTYSSIDHNQSIT